MKVQVIAHLRSIRYLVWLGVMVVLSLVLAGRPLFNLLGFEFAFAVALVNSVACLDLGAAFVRRKRAETSDDGRSPGHVVIEIWQHATVANLTLLLAPLLIMTLNAFRVRNCDFGFGFKAYLLMPVMSSVVATTWGVLAGIVAGRRKVLSNAMPYLIILSAVIYAVWHFYSTPSVFNYNMFVGYFPGNLYDEHLAFSSPFYWSRVFQLCFLASLFFLVVALVEPTQLRLDPNNIRDKTRVRWLPLAGHFAVGLLTLILWTKSGALGFSVNADDIKKALGARHETDNFIIYYEPGGVIERDIELIAEDHEFRYAQLVRDLGVDMDSKITSFYFTSADQKFKLMGARRVYMAKPWRKEIYMNHSSFPHQVVRHEIAHVVAGEFGDSIFAVSAKKVLGLPVFFNVGMIEGIAVAADWPNHFTHYLTPHQSVKAMIELKLAPPVHKIFSTGFMQFSSARSYTLAGSFVKFMLDRYGAKKLHALYRSGGKFQESYGKPQAAFIKEWRTMIDTIKLPKDAAKIVRERFRRVSIFKRPCAHAIASKRRRVGELASTRRIKSAVRLQRSVCSDVPREPRFQMTLAELLRMDGEIAEASRLLNKIADNDKNISSSLRAEALFELATIAAHKDDWANVKLLLERVKAMPLPPGHRRNVNAQLMATSHAGKAGPALRAYFWPGDEAMGDPILRAGLAAAIIAAEPELPIGHYLMGRVTSGRAKPDVAALSLQRALDLGLKDPLMIRECARLLAISAYRAGDYAQVTRAANLLLKTDNKVMQLYGKDWLERVHWKKHGELPAQ